MSSKKHRNSDGAEMTQDQMREEILKKLSLLKAFTTNLPLPVAPVRTAPTPTPDRASTPTPESFFVGRII